MHKSAGELKPRDNFLMAGGHYRILDIYETDDAEVIRVSFVPVNKQDVRRSILTMPRSLLFKTD